MEATAITTQPSVWAMPFEGPWFVLRYCPTTLWSLKSSQATSSGGKSLLVPTPYSIKLGLIDAAIQTGNVADGEELFQFLRGRPLRICPPTFAVVSATFVRLWKVDVCPDKSQKETEVEYELKVRQVFLEYFPLADADTVAKTPLDKLRRILRETFSPTVGFREYVQFNGDGEGALFQIAVAAKGITSDERKLLARAAYAYSYSGKRGSFLRFVPVTTEDGLEEIGEISQGAPYTLPRSVWQSSGVEVRLGTIQSLDELSTSAEWNNVSTYGSGQVYAAQEGMWVSVRKKQIAPDRVFVHTLIPYRLVSSSRGYAYYQRTDIK